MPAEPMVEQTLAEHIASLRERKYEVPVIRDPNEATDDAVAGVEKSAMRSGPSSAGLRRATLNFLRF